MYNTSLFLLIFMIFALAIALVYFYIFSRSQEKFMRYWGISWIFYSISLIFLILYLNSNLSWLLNIRVVFDLLNILFLLFGAYAFMHISIPSHWLKFSLYLIIWVMIGILYGLDNYIISLPVSIYQFILCISLCTIIWKYWNIQRLEKIISIIIFLLWGISKSVFSFLEVRYQNPSLLKMLEIILSNIMSFSILLIYVQKIRKELTRIENQFRIIAENVTDIIFYYQLKPHSCFSYISPSVEKTTGYSPQEFYNNPKLHIEITHPDDQKNAQFLFIPENNTSAEILRWYTKEGNILWVEFHNSMIFENGEIVAIEGIILDITRQKSAEDDLIQSKKSQQLLFSYVSHELRTPVTSILGYISAIRDGTFDTQAKVNQAIDLIFSKAVTLQRLINDLFQLSQLETKQFSFNFMQVSVSELFGNIIGKYTLDIKNAGLDCITNINEVQSLKCDIIADPERMEQVFSNIFFNAIRYTNKNGSITVLCKYDVSRKLVLFSISDTGRGIPEKELNKVFDRFYQSSLNKPVEGKKGSGLGLTIAKEIIEAHGGKISVQSTVGVGSTFNISLPLYFES